MAEGDPGTRRYKWFRPRQAHRGTTGQLGAVAAHGSLGELYNSSSGPTVLVVRGLVIAATATTLVNCGNSAARLTTNNVRSAAYFGSNPAGAGIVDGSSALPVITTFDFQFVAATTFTPVFADFPLAIVEPGWSFYVQDNTANQAFGASFIWEEVSIDELEYFYF